MGSEGSAGLGFAAATADCAASLADERVALKDMSVRFYTLSLSKVAEPSK